jgi:ketosteroid isomerase-like protein/ribosomal protein S18 acetylase RimI-like enzyme
MSQENVEVVPRIATEADLDGVTRALTAAFEHDPLWSWAFPDPAALAVWWRFCIRSALRYPCVWVAGDYAAASVWVPPGATELTEDEEARVKPLLTGLAGPRAGQIIELVSRFEASHPRDVPHWYLSLLGTAPDARGRGLGMGLLAENLSDMDAEGVPTYLESTNPDNNARYERLGFRQIGEFTTPDGARTVATMWRDAAGSAPGPPSGPDKIAVIEAAYEALADDGLDRFLDHWTEDLDHRSIEGAPDDRGPLRGRDAMRAYVQDWIDTFDGFEIHPIELIDGGGNIVVAVLRYGGRAKLSGVPTDSTFGVVFSIRGEKIARGREYPTRREALKAAGLSE